MHVCYPLVNKSLNQDWASVGGVQSHTFSLLAADVQAHLLCKDVESLSVLLNVWIKVRYDGDPCVQQDVQLYLITFNHSPCFTGIRVYGCYTDILNLVFMLKWLPNSSDVYFSLQGSCMNPFFNLIKKWFLISGTTNFHLLYLLLLGFFTLLHKRNRTVVITTLCSLPMSANPTRHFLVTRLIWC